MINSRLVTSWDDVLAYPMIKLSCNENCSASTQHASSDICLFDYCDILQTANPGSPPKEIARLVLGFGLTKRAEIKLVRKKYGLVGFKIDDGCIQQHLVVFDVSTLKLMNNLR